MFKNLGINSGLLLASIVVMVLIYALFTRIAVRRIDPFRTLNPAGLLGNKVQVEIRNGAGKSGLAADATSYLRKVGFDVVASGNFIDFDQPYTHIIDRVGDRESTKNLAYALGIDESRIEEDIDTDLFLDATVVLGADFRRLKMFTE